ncbi:MAG: hypothetical protein Q8K63_00645 [Acidimicrobiales bacterium]|nr:hypothetical protein [Acidimicrobiales bacterium]
MLEQASVNHEGTWNQQLSAIDWSTEGMRAPTLHHLVYQGFRPGSVTRRAIDYYADRIDESRIPTADTPGALVTYQRGSLEERGRWDYDDLEDFLTSPTFAPRQPGTGGSRYAGADPGGHNGYVVMPVQNDCGFRVEVFDASRVSDGPVAVAEAKGKTAPLLLHAAWMHRAVPAVDAQRMSFADDLTADALAALPAEFHGVAHEIADEVSDRFA